MTSLENELRATLHALDQTPITDPDLEDRVLAGMRRRRRSNLAVAASGTIGLAAASVALVFAVTGIGDKNASPSLADIPDGNDCTGMRAGATGMSAHGPANLVLGFENAARRGTACTIDAQVDVVLTAGSDSVTSSYEAASADIPGQTKKDTSAIVYLSWHNWCATGPVTATTTFGDGTTVVQKLGAAGFYGPGCNDPDQPAQLALTRADIAAVAPPPQRQTQ